VFLWEGAKRGFVLALQCLASGLEAFLVCKRVKGQLEKRHGMGMGLMVVQ